MSAFPGWPLEIARNALRVSLELFKIMIPVLVVVRVLERLGIIELLAAPLSPFMALAGLPPETGLAWAAAMFNSIYAGLLVLASMPLAEPLTTAQVTVLSTMLLVAHGLPVELRIAARAGVRYLVQLVLRCGGALLLGMTLDRTFSALNVLQEPAQMLWAPPPQADPSWLSWAVDQATNLGSIFLIILGLMAFLRLLEALRATELMHRLLAPLLGMLGIGREAGSITIVGLTLGLSYGGGLIIHEAESGRVSSRDVFYAVSLMGLCHSLFEDTLLMLLTGAHLSGILWGRLAFSLVAVALLVRLTRRLPDSVFERWCGRDVRRISS